VNKITICRNTVISLTGTGDAFSSSRSSFSVDCQAGGFCQFIRKGGSGRIFNFSGRDIELNGLTFDNGNAVGGGGAVYIAGDSNRIENCIFRDNRATGNSANGGAVNWDGGVLVSSRGFNNVATGICNGVYDRKNGQCDIAVNGGTNVDQCRAFCNEVQNCASRPGHCLSCDFFTNTCTNQSQSQCGKRCNVDSDCNSFAGECTVCNSSKQCDIAGSQSQCGKRCNVDSDCNSFAGECIVCNSSKQCDIAGSQSQCGKRCNVDSDCNSVAGECTVCNSSKQCDIAGSQSQCGKSCNVESDCNSFAGECTVCNSSNLCELPGTVRTCANSDSMLRTALQDSSSNSAIVEICANANIQLSSEISTSVSNKTLRCESGARTCSVTRGYTGSNFRLLNFSGNNIVLSDITFSNGKVTSGDGGGVLLNGTGNVVQNVAFTGNTAVSTICLASIQLADREQIVVLTITC
jgi:hypothetical protein